MTDEENEEYRVSKKCPSCGWRILDRVTPSSGIIELKCPKCGKYVRLNLSFRCVISRPYNYSNNRCS